jgi:hypothetical protein
MRRYDSRMDAKFPELLTPHDVASWLHTTSKFVLGLVRRGEIPHLLLPNGDILFERADLADWVRSFRAGKRQSEAESVKTIAGDGGHGA